MEKKTICFITFKMEEDMQIEEPKSTKKDNSKKFEVKKWNAVVLWAWGMKNYQYSIKNDIFTMKIDIIVDNCAICRNDINEFCMFT